MNDQEKEKKGSCKDWFPADLQLSLGVGLSNDNDHKGNCSTKGEDKDHIINTKLSLALTPHSSTAT